MAQVTFTGEEVESVLTGLADYISRLDRELRLAHSINQSFAYVEELNRRRNRAVSAREKVYQATGK